uniref:Uncharacterized protein n=1 Tax=Arundo donax TaxID=35708 RepID=A0A0A9BL89_ARUDO
MKLQAFFSVVLAKASLLAPQQFEAIMKQEVRRLALARRCGLFLCAVATNDTAVASHEVRNVLSHGLLPNLGLHAQPTHEENPGGRGSSKPDASPSFLVASSGPSRAHYRGARHSGEEAANGGD